MPDRRAKGSNLIASNLLITNRIRLGGLGVSPLRSANQEDIYAAITSNTTWVRFSLVGNSAVNGREVGARGRANTSPQNSSFESLQNDF